jgi:hypothetical protein
MLSSPLIKANHLSLMKLHSSKVLYGICDQLRLSVHKIVPWCAWEGVGKTLQVID